MSEGIDVDPFSSEDEPDEGDTATQGGDNKTIKQLREAIERAEKRNRALEKDNEKLIAFQSTVLAERKNETVSKVFTEAGLSPKHAELYKRVNPDVEADAITAEAVKTFAEEYGLAAGAVASTPDVEESKPQGFTPVTTGISPSASEFSMDDVDTLMKQGDFDTVNRIFKEKRVQEDDVPWTQYAG